MAQSPKKPDLKLTQENLVQFRTLISDHFGDNDIREICFDLGVDYENLPGNHKALKVIELINFTQRNGRLRELFDLCKKTRPHGDWASLIDNDSQSFRGYVDPDFPTQEEPFLNREKQIARIKEGLTKPKGLISIEGMGGNGKTALALEIAKRLQSHKIKLPTPFEVYIYIAGRDTHLTLNALLDKIAGMLNQSYIHKLTGSEKEAEVNSLLRKQHIFILVDNLETIQDDTILPYLTRVPEPSKVLVTARKLVTANRWKVGVKGLELEAALKFIRNRIRSLELSELAKLDKRELLPLIKITAANPYALRAALSVIEVGESTISNLIEELSKGQGRLDKVLREIFELSWNSLNTNAQHLLMLMSFFPESASRVSLQGIMHLTQEAFDEAVRQLGRGLLLDVSTVVLQESLQRFSIHSLTLAFVKGKVASNPAWETKVREQWANWFLTFAHENKGNDWFEEKDEGHALLEIEWINLKEVFAWCEQQGKYRTKIQDFWLDESTSEFTSSYGHWDARLKWLYWLLEIAKQQGDNTAEVECSSGIIWTLTRRGGEDNLAKADRLVEPTWNLKNHVSFRVASRLADNIAVLRTNQHHYEEAQSWFRDALDLLDKSKVEDISRARRRCHILYYQADYHRQQTGGLEQAEKLYQEGMSYAQSGRWQRGIYYFQQRLADVAIMQGNLDEAETLLETGSQMAERRQDRRAIANYNASFAKLENRRGNYAQRNYFATKALIVFKQLGMKLQETEMEQLLSST